MSNKIVLAPLDCYQDKLIKEIYSAYLNGCAIDEILMKINISGEFTTTEIEINYIIDEINLCLL